ncbi:putative signal transducing protein [Sphingobacterium bambusae]|uniref:Signal transducing protein n=1 Tax=Sphingobacterium bambusae TaxID=662858 RepID=A0ABW6BLL8_9SPHI|nr:DUF2007 domain-containing protein [Sphingobacterium bambusae]WPL46642.1 DUF2007 domain-containing protein [Sphingobacterium bambusae]
MEKGWVKIATYSNELTAELAKLALEQNGVMAVLLNKQDSSLKFGRIELFVQENDQIKAAEIMETNDTNGLNEN